MRVDIWSDIACPWCYIGLTRFRRVLAGFEHADAVEVTLHSYQLDPNLPESFAGTEADYLAQRKGMPLGQVGQMFGHVERAAATEGLTLDFAKVAVANSWRAHRLIHAAQGVSPEVAERVKLALFKAHFVDGESIADAAVLTRIAAEAGVPDDQAARAASGSFAPASDDDLDAAVHADLRQAAEYGITGVPFFVLENKYGISGAQPAEVFEQALRQVWDEIHPRSVIQPVGGIPSVQGGPACGPEGCA